MNLFETCALFVKVRRLLIIINFVHVKIPILETRIILFRRDVGIFGITGPFEYYCDSLVRASEIWSAALLPKVWFENECMDCMSTFKLAKTQHTVDVNLTKRWKKQANSKVGKIFNAIASKGGET